MGAHALPSRFLETNVKSLIFTIGASPGFAYCPPPPILMPTPAYA